MRRSSMFRRLFWLLALAPVAPLGCGLIDDITLASSPEDAGAGVDALTDAVSADVVTESSATVPTTPFFAMMRQRLDSGAPDPDAGVAYAFQPAVIDLGAATAGPRAIGCRSSGSFGYFGPSPGAGGFTPPTSPPNGPYLNGMLIMRAHYTPDPMVPPGDARLVYLDVVPNGADDGDGGRVTDYPLYVVDESSDCVARKPSRIDYLGPFVAGARHVLPRFSPNGKRIAYFDISNGIGLNLSVLRLVTVGVDGSEPRVLRRTTDLTSPESMWLAPPSWVDDGNVAWNEVDDKSTGSGAGNIRVMIVKDAPLALPSTLLECGRQKFYGIEQIEFFVQGATSRVALVANDSQWLFTAKGGPSNVHTGNFGASCDQLKNVTHEPGPGSLSRDLAVSPDGSLFLFASNREPSAADGGDAAVSSLTVTSPMHLWIMSSIGGVAQPCSGVDPSADDVGAQWLDRGTKVAWMHLPRGDGGPGAVMLADVIGGRCSNVRTLLGDAPGTGAGDSPTYITSTNASVHCSAVMGRHSSGGALASLFTLLTVAMVMVRRASRRRSTRADSRTAVAPPRVL